jgi:hypothetical protein
MKTVRNKTERKAKIKMGGRREERSRKHGSEKFETEGPREEMMERNNSASQNS